ncbi:MAG: hypothetical protein LBP51_03625 [Deferribacteraceae bacterium]|jgi:hypothetical protein|nr:hypothetical protein [Deferribacteraceae bacterium]
MITSVKYLPIFIASVIMLGSYLFKVLFADLKLTYLLRDIILFFILYYVVKLLAIGIERILKNYWKIL